MDTEKALNASVQAYPVKVRCMEVAMSTFCVMLACSCSRHSRLLSFLQYSVVQRQTLEA